MTTARHYRPLRRGMLLLMVLLMLSLFMAIGALLLTVGLRTRNAVRAYGDAAISTSTNDNLSRELLDAAILAALRGSPAVGNGSVADTGGSDVWENLLEDKYGKPVFATGSIQPGATSPTMTLSLSTFLESGTIPGQLVASPLGTAPARLGGRVLTIKPRGADGDMASYRILGGTIGPAGLTVHVATAPASGYRRLPRGVFDVVINGREFTPVSGTSVPEAYDAYDDGNKWLAQPVIEAGQVSHLNRGSFIGEIFPPASSNPSAPTTDFELLPPEDVVDNDNDGVRDGVWFPPTTASLAEEGFGSGLNAAINSGTASPFPQVIPDRPSPLGGTIRTQVSYLILDLDGRININAAGVSTPSGNIYGNDRANVPLGMGYGPADLDPSLLFPATLPVPSGSNSFITTSTGTWQPLLQSGTPTLSGTLIPTTAQRRVQPLLGLIEGRYGRNGKPGIDGDDIGPFQLTGTATGTSGSGTAAPTYWSLVTGSTGASLADLQGRRKVYMEPPATGDITPTLTFFTGTAATATAAEAARLDATDDPYELRLDADAPRPADYRRLLTGTETGTTANRYTVDNPFTLAELERVLRANDPDALQLPQRLAAGAAQHAQQARMTITTDSWDTPALTGLAAQIIEDYIATNILPLNYSGTSSWWSSGAGASNPVSPDIAAGLRFNINRPVLSGTSTDALRQQHEYCKGLYTLALMLGETNATRAAQWAVNALDFRDEDDRISWFEYDTNISNGWNVDGLLSSTESADRAVVWGMERPDVVIAETAAAEENPPSSEAQILLTLRRMSHTVTSTNTISASGTISSTELPLVSPIWQVRFGADDRVIRFNPNAPSPPTPYFSAESGARGLVEKNPSLVFTGTSSVYETNPHILRTGSDAFLCICPQTTKPPFSVTGIPKFQIVTTNTFALKAAGDSMVYLERLADPSNPTQAGTPSNPYVVVDKAPVYTGNRSLRRPASQPNSAAAFWATAPNRSGWSNGDAVLSAYPAGGPSIKWFHWPNRPFISQAELSLVPTGAATPYEYFADPSFPESSLILSGTAPIARASGTSSLGNLLLDATYVPSRFAGNAITITGTALDPFGLDILKANQLSKWREPGKVNVNTIVTGTSRDTVDSDDVVWSILISGTTPNPFLGKPRTRTQPAIPGHGTTETIPASPGKPGEPGTIVRNVPHLLGLLRLPRKDRDTEPVPPAYFPLFVTPTNSLIGDTNGFRDTNPFFTYAQAIRLANTATIRSQVFAVWVSVRITDDSPNAPSPVTKRLFAIIDRSIPVGYAPGQDLNVRDTIRLKRYLD